MNIDEIRARAEAATPAPWEWNKSRFYDGYSGITGKDNAEVLFPNHCNDGDDGAAWFEDFPNDADREFISHAREDIPALLDALEQLRAENISLRAEREQARLDCAVAERNHMNTLARFLEAQERITELTAERDALLKAVEKPTAERGD